MVEYQTPDLSGITGLSDSNEHTPVEDYILQQLMALLTQKNNLHGRRIGKAKDAIKPGDYVTKRQITSTLVGTLAKRPGPLTVPTGTLYYATDRTVTYININGHWNYFSGTQRGLLSAKPAPSILYDNNYRYYATDYDWEFYWDLSNWNRIGGANLYIQGFKTAPTKNGWALCDGSTHNYSTDAGGTSSVTTPDLTTNARFLAFYNNYDAAVAAVAPTASGGSLTGTLDLPSHSHGLSTLTLSGVTTGIQNQDHQHESGTYQADDGAPAVGGVVGISIAVLDSSTVMDVTGISDFQDNDHDHNLDGIDFSAYSTDPESGESIDISGLSISSITISNTGTPPAISLLPYIRL